MREPNVRGWSARRSMLLPIVGAVILAMSVGWISHDLIHPGERTALAASLGKPVGVSALDPQTFLLVWSTGAVTRCALRIVPLGTELRRNPYLSSTDPREGESPPPPPSATCRLVSIHPASE
jgi:hypothetical protein